MKDWMIRLTLLAFGFFVVGVSLVVVEFYLSKFAPAPETYPTGFYKPDEHIGWKGIPGEEKKYLKGRIVLYVRMNSHGFRDKERTYEKEKDTFRILVLGDSMTEGLQVPLEEAFPYILEEKLNSQSGKRFEVINLGVSGFGTAQEYLTLKQYGLNYQPDLVILAVFLGNDVQDNSFTLESESGRTNKPFFVMNNGKLQQIPFRIKVINPSKDGEQTKEGVAGRLRFQVLKNIILNLFPNIYYSISDRINETPWLASFLWDLGIKKSKPESLDKSKKNGISNYYYVYAKSYPPEWQDAWEVTKALILRTSEELRENKKGFLVVIIPNEFEFQPDKRNETLENPQLSNLIELKKPEGILSSFLMANGIDYLLLRPEFEKYTKETGKDLHFHFAYENHWNANGHALTAELIYRKLKRNELLPQKVGHVSR